MKCYLACFGCTIRFSVSTLLFLFLGCSSASPVGGRLDMERRRS